MRVLLTGARGQLGRAVEALAPQWGWEVWGFSRHELDITQEGQVREVAFRVQPELIVNAAAFTAVDRAEEEPAQAFAVNAQGVAFLAQVADELGALLLHISTDYVFDGRSRSPYGEEASPNPLSVYGRSKRAGEEAAKTARHHLIVRTSWLFGDGWNFVEAIRKQILQGARELKVVADQVGRPTWAVSLAQALAQLVERRARGLYHVANSGTATWARFAEEIVKQLGVQVPVVPISTAEAGRPAPRPSYSVLDTGRFEALCGRLPPWEEALRAYLSRRPTVAP